MSVATSVDCAGEQLQARANSVPYWWHSIDLGQGVVTRGHKSAAHLARELESLKLPDLRGKTVLDIGAWDGFYSFAAERGGARRVVALDYASWLCGAAYSPEYERECRARGVAPDPHSDPRNIIWLFRPEEQPGKQGFDLARQARGSKVESVVADFMAMDLEELGTFDVVLFLGVLYHMENPLDSLKRVAAVTREVAIIETQAIVLPGYEHHALCEFFESDELNHDPSNWWVPNEKAVTGLCRAADFSRVETIVGPPALSQETGPEIRHYRAVVHAWK